MAFVQNGIAIAVSKTEPVTTTCSGLFCDKQRVYDWIDARGCGCYHIVQQRSNLAINHSISVYTSPATTILMTNISSTAFSKLYLSSNIPATTSLVLFVIQMHSLTSWIVLKNLSILSIIMVDSLLLVGTGEEFQ